MLQYAWEKHIVTFTDTASCPTMNSIFGWEERWNLSLPVLDWLCLVTVQSKPEYLGLLWSLSLQSKRLRAACREAICIWLSCNCPTGDPAQSVTTTANVIWNMLIWKMRLGGTYINAFGIRGYKNWKRTL